MRTSLLLSALLLTACFSPSTQNGTGGQTASSSSASGGEVRLLSPVEGRTVRSPLTVRGEAPGPWFFEANIVVELTDEAGERIAATGMMATEEWMTTDMVSFEGEIEFETDAEEGFLVIHRDNASGLPEHDKSEKFPIKYQ